MSPRERLLLRACRACAVAVAVAVAALASAWARPARAEDETEGARLFREGRELMLDERFAEACPKLEASQRLEPHTGTLLNVAACHERVGKVATAWTEYQNGLTAARAEGQVDRVELARHRIEVLEPRVPWLTIDVGAATRALDGLVVTLDGAAIRPAAFGREMPVDPGPHVTAARASRRLPFEASVDVHEGERRVVTIAGLDADGSPAPAPALAPAPEPPILLDAGARDAPPATKPSEEERSRIVFEIGPVMGFLSTRGAVRDPGEVELTPSGGATGAPTTSCASQPCTVDAENGGMILGLTAFAGYAVTDPLHVGVRFVGAARVSEGGGDVLAVGPGASYRVSGPLRVGLWGLLGYSAVSGPTVATVPPGYATDGLGNRTGSTDICLGGGAEATFELGHIGSGVIEFTSTPLFFVGPNGSAWSVPLGLAYRTR